MSAAMLVLILSVAALLLILSHRESLTIAEYRPGCYPDIDLELIGAGPC